MRRTRVNQIRRAALAAKIDVSEATLYRHSASKAQMFEGLMEFIESSIFGLINQITVQDKMVFRKRSISV